MADGAYRNSVLVSFLLLTVLFLKKMYFTLVGQCVAIGKTLVVLNVN